MAGSAGADGGSFLSGSANEFTYTEMVINSIYPTHGPTEGGGVILIRGANFGLRDFKPKIFVGEQPCLASAWHDDSELSCVVPAGIGESQHVKVQVLSKANLNNVNYMYSYDAPTLVSVSMNESHTVGNESMLVRGTNFGPRWAMPTVTVGGVPCLKQKTLSHKELVCLVPPGVGVRRRVVVAVAERYTREERFVLNYLPPALGSISPRVVRTLGGTITITGSDFGTMSPDESDMSLPPVHLSHKLRRASFVWGIRPPQWGIWFNTTGASTANVTSVSCSLRVYGLGDSADFRHEGGRLKKRLHAVLVAYLRVRAMDLRFVSVDDVAPAPQDGDAALAAGTGVRLLVQVRTHEGQAAGGVRFRFERIRHDMGNRTKVILQRLLAKTHLKFDTNALEVKADLPVGLGTRGVAKLQAIWRIFQKEAAAKGLAPFPRPARVGHPADDADPPTYDQRVTAASPAIAATTSEFAADAQPVARRRRRRRLLSQSTTGTVAALVLLGSVGGPEAAASSAGS